MDTKSQAEMKIERGDRTKHRKCLAWTSYNLDYGGDIGRWMRAE